MTLVLATFVGLVCKPTCKDCINEAKRLEKSAENR